MPVKANGHFRVALCSTKPTSRGKLLIQSFASGLEKHGDGYIELNNFSKEKIEQLKRCDTLFYICEYNSRVKNSHENDFRGWCKEYAKTTVSGRRIILDVGFVKNHTDTPDIALQNAYWSIGLDGIKGNAKYYNENSLSDRWQSFGIELKPWRANGDYILVLGQNEVGISTQHINYVDWMNNTIYRLKELTDRPIKFMAHRHQTEFPRDVEILKGVSIYEAVKNTWCTVARTTNGAAGSIISGVPVITEDISCIAYDVSSHSLEDVINPHLPDRNQWCNNLGYSQWNIKEIKRGECWNHLRRYIYSVEEKV